MLPYAARAIPCPRIALAAALVVVLMELVRWNAWVLWPLEGVAVGLVGAATAWCFDEAAAAVADTAPRGLAWQAAARAPGPLVLAATWTATVLHAGDEALFGHAAAVLVQGFAAMAAGAALALWSRGRGSATPGLQIATVTVPVATAEALVRPLGAGLPVFPYGDSPSSAWQVSTAGWTGATALSVAVLALALGEVRWTRERLEGHRPRRWPSSRRTGQALGRAAPM